MSAVEVGDLKILSRSYDTINKDSMCDFVRSLRGEHPSGERITLVLDNASYNRAWKLRSVASDLNIGIMYLPSYSPNLNPSERLWKFMRKRALPNEYCEDFKSWKNAIMGFFRGIRKYRPELKTLITDNFELMGT